MSCWNTGKSLIDYLFAVGPIAISTLVVWIAYLQFQVNRKKFRLDLFNRRFSIYEKTLDYFLACYQNGGSENNHAFVKAYREAFFLFGSESEVYRSLTSIKDAIASNHDPQKLMEKLECDLLPWFDFNKIDR